MPFGPVPAARHWPLVGRSAEMQALFALVDAARRGDGGIATLIGPAGSGKTRLLDELVEHAQWRGPGHDVALTIRRGRVPVLGTDTPFAAPLAAFSLGLGRFGTATAAPRSLIEASVGDRASAAGVVEQLLSLVDSEVAAGPLLLVLDDLHEADIGTVSFVEQLVPRLASIPVALVLASRPTRSGPFRRWLDQGASLVIQLQPLTSDDVAEMARLFLGGHPGPRLRHVLDAAGPLPLFATAILESIHPPDLSGGPDATVDLAEAAAAQLLAQAPRAVASRLEELRDETRQPLLAAAVLGDTFAASRVMAMLGTTLSQTIDALERAEHAGLLITEGNTYRFRHDLYRDAVLASASKPVLALLHERAAEVCDAAGDAPLAIARHVVEADAQGEHARAWLIEAAESVVAYDPVVALELAERAMRIRGVPSRSLQLVHLRALGSVGRRDEVETLTRQMLASTSDPAEEVALHRELALSLFQQGRAAESMAEMLAGVELAGGPLNDRDLHRRLSAEAGVACILAARFGDAAALAEGVLADPALDLVSEICATMVLALVRMFGNQRAEARALGERLERLTALPHLGEATLYQPWFAAALVRIDIDDLVGARRVAAEGHRRSAEAGYQWMVPAYDTLRASAAFRAGDLADAAAAANAALDWRIDDRLGTSLWCHCIVARTALHQGDAELAAHHLRVADDLVAQGVGHLDLDHLVMAHLATFERSGNYAQALNMLGSIWDLYEGHGALSALQELSPAVVRTSVLSGDESRIASAMTYLDALTSTIGDTRAAADAARARAWATGDPAFMQRAIELKARTPRRLECATMIAELAELHRRAGNTRKAAAAARNARGAFLECGAVGDAARLDVEFGTATNSTRSVGPAHDLSPSERRVVEMVAEGRSNSEIAEALFVSRRTIESHVSAAYRKLGVTNRVELARLAMTFDPA